MGSDLKKKADPKVEVLEIRWSPVGRQVVEWVKLPLETEGCRI